MKEWMLWAWMSVWCFTLTFVDAPGGVVTKMLGLVVAYLPIGVFHLRERLKRRRGLR